MNVLLIGASGATGREVLPRLLDAGHHVRALVRRPDAISVTHAQLTILHGDVRSDEAIERAVAGQHAVVCTFGPRSLKRDDVQEVLMKNLVGAMERHGVRRVVNLAAWVSGRTAQYAPRWQRWVAAVVLGRVFADKERGEKILFASTLDYVNVSPGRLLNAPPRGGVDASIDGKGLQNAITRADVAAWMVAQLTSDAWLRTCPIIGYPSR